MLYNFLITLIDQFSALNVFRYLTFRTGLSVMSSILIVFLIGGPFIKFIESHKITGPIREDGPIDHIIKKVGTPTMGGVLILIGILFFSLLWADLKNSYIFFTYAILYLSLLFGFYFNEDFTLGYKTDHFIHLEIISLFENNFLDTLLNFNNNTIFRPDDLDFTTAHSPFFYIIYSLCAPDV